MCGSLLELAFRWHERGHSPDDDYWRFLVELVDRAVASWEQPDPGIWEIRKRPMHFVHSKVMCWAALDRGLRLAKDTARRAPVRDHQRDAGPPGGDLCELPETAYVHDARQERHPDTA